MAEGGGSLVSPALSTVILIRVTAGQEAHVTKRGPLSPFMGTRALLLESLGGPEQKVSWARAPSFRLGLLGGSGV